MEKNGRISTKMNLMISLCRVIKSIIGRRTNNAGICRPGNISSSSLKHLLGNSIIILIRKSYLYLHFKEVNKTSDSKRNEDVSPVCCLQAHNANHHAKHYQYTSMTPQKVQRLDGVIKDLLHFMNSSNLHVLLINFLHKYIILVQFLKIHVITQKRRVINAEKLPKKIDFRRS